MNGGEFTENCVFRGLRVQREAGVCLSMKRRERERAEKNYLPCAMSHKPSSSFMLAQFKRVKNTL